MPIQCGFFTPGKTDWTYANFVLSHQCTAGCADVKEPIKTSISELKQTCLLMRFLTPREKGDLSAYSRWQNEHGRGRIGI